LLSRDVEVDPHHAALLFIDVQNCTALRDGGEYRGLNEQQIEERFGFFFRTMGETAIPNMQRLQPACRRGASRCCTPSSKA
jgi:ureidoacrylate peracid hydrolase